MANTPRRRYQRARRLFGVAVDLGTSERFAFVRRESAGDEELANEVVEMLAADGAAGKYFEHLDREALRSDEDARIVGLRRVGPYRLVRKIGEGGLSVVYEAHRDDAEYEQRVAVKFLRVGLESDLTLERLRAERQILATLDHPHIWQGVVLCRTVSSCARTITSANTEFVRMEFQE